MAALSRRASSLLVAAAASAAGPAIAARGADLPGYHGLRAADEAPLRQQRAVGWSVPAGAAEAWKALQDHLGPSWRALWDATTGVPLRAYGPGVAAPGA